MEIKKEVIIKDVMGNLYDHLLLKKQKDADIKFFNANSNNINQVIKEMRRQKKRVVIVAFNEEELSCNIE